MNEFPNPDSWLDILDHVWVGLVLLGVAAIPSMFAARNHKGIQEVKAQVKNAHSTNLRDDIDRAISAVEALGHDVRGIRTDLASEEDRRRQQIRELRDDVERRLNRG
jgi:uncharacterized protein (UPF0264 family)